MDIGISNIVPVIVDGSSQYLATYAPLFVLIGGIILAVGVVAKLLSLFTKRNIDVFEGEDDIL